MNQIEQLRDDLVKRFPACHSTSMSRPMRMGLGFCLCDTKRILCHSRSSGGLEWAFGISTPDPEDFGAGADEIYPNVQGGARPGHRTDRDQRSNRSSRFRASRRTATTPGILSDPARRTGWSQAGQYLKD